MKDEQIEKTSQYKPFENATEIRFQPNQIIRDILQIQATDDQQLKMLILSQFLMLRQNIFEASLYYNYLPEFNNLSNFYQIYNNEKFEYYIKKGVFERSLSLENEKYVEIFLQNPYYLTLDFSQENYHYIEACQYEEKNKTKPILNAYVMMYYYSIEHLCPKLMKFILNNVEDILELKQMFQHLVLIHLNSYAKQAFLKIYNKKQDSEKEIINLCLNSFNFDFLFEYYEVTGVKIKGWIEETENQRLMVKALGRCTGINFQSLVFFIRQITLWSQKDLIHLMAETLYERLDASKNESSFLFTFSNPLQVIVLIIEILQITLRNEFFYKNMLEKTRKKYFSFAQKLIKTAIDEDQMYDILVDSDIQGRKLLYIIYQNSMSDLIADEKVQDVIDILWYGNTNTTSNISIGQNLLNTNLQKQLPEMNKKLILYPFDSAYKSEDFVCRLSVWKNQICLRHLIDELLVVMFLVLFLIYFLQSFSIFTQGFMPVNDDREVVESAIQQFQDNMSKWIIVNIFIGVNMPLSAIVSLAYLREYERNDSVNADQIFDILFAICTNLYTIFVYTMQYFSYDNVQLIMIIFLNILSVFCYIRIILCLTATKSFGIILQALSVIFIEVAKFFKPFMAILLLFSFIGFILFNPLTAGKFVSFYSGMLFLVEAMFGQFQFASFQDQFPITGSIFMILHLYALNVIFMNILVAILAFNFEKTNRQARTLHYQHIIYHIRQGNFLERHGCLILVPVLLEFTLIPYLILKKYFHYASHLMKKAENIYIYLSYSPIYIIIISTTIAFNLVLLPFAYLQRLFALTKLYFYKLATIDKLLFWLFFGIIYQLKRLFFDDMKVLSSYLLQKESQDDLGNQIQKKITFDPTIRQIFKTVCKMYVSGLTYCTISELFVQVKENMQNPSEQHLGSCVGDDQIIGVHLLKKNSAPPHTLSFLSPSLEKMKSQRRLSTPMQLHLLQKQNSKNSVQKIDKINVKHTFQGIPQMEEDCEQIYEYFEKFCFKDIAREDEQRDSVLNLQNILKLHEHYHTNQLSVAIHYQLYKVIKTL